MIIKHGRQMFWEIHEVRKGLWAFFFLVVFFDADWLGRQTPMALINCIWSFSLALHDTRSIYPQRLQDSEMSLG